MIDKNRDGYTSLYKFDRVLFSFDPVYQIPYTIIPCSFEQLGLLRQNTYLMKSINYDTGVIVLGDIFIRNHLDKNTPPYSAIMQGDFYKTDIRYSSTEKEEYYYIGGFSIV